MQPIVFNPYSKVEVQDNGQTFVYTNGKEEISQVKGFVPKETYKTLVENFPIPCVDVFLYNDKEKTYFQVLRKDKPAQGMWWFPGGRLQKGEKFFTCAERKCKEEANLDVVASKILCVAATLFSDSAWETPTHTVNTCVFAVLQNTNQQPSIDSSCQNHRWESIENPPEDPYLLKIYQKAVKKIKKDNEKSLINN